MITIIETSPFLKAAEKFLTMTERNDLIDFLARNPEAGNEIVGTGGVRKLRFASSVRGKSGGTRVIYFFFDRHAPLYLLTCYSKSSRADLSRSEINAFEKLTTAIKAQHRRQRQ